MNRQLTATYVLLAALAVTSSVSGQVPGPMPPTAVAPNLAAQAMGSFAGPAIGAVQPALYSARPGQRGAVQQVTFPPAAFPGGQRGPFAPGPFAPGPFPPGAVQPAAFQADCPDCGPPSGSGGPASRFGSPCGCGAGAGGPFVGDHGPQGSGGCCLPRWFDVQAEWLFWDRDFSESQVFSSEGILGPAALSGRDLDVREESGYRLTGAYLIGPATALEASYFGGFNWASSAVATSDGNLFSVFSDFGSDPLNGFPETGFGNEHSLAFSSEMDNAELNLRHRWVSADCLWHSAWMVGVRYFRLREDLVYATQTDTGSMSYQLKTDNDLVGVQTGTELYLCLTPRFKIGGEAEAGLFGTHSEQRTNMISTSSPALKERDSERDVALVAEANLSALYRVTPRLKLRAGYSVLFVDGVATAFDNFNTQSPFAARASFINANGDVFYHGSNLGFEWTW